LAKAFFSIELKAGLQGGRKRSSVPTRSMRRRLTEAVAEIAHGPPELGRADGWGFAQQVTDQSMPRLVSIFPDRRSSPSGPGTTSP